MSTSRRGNEHRTPETEQDHHTRELEEQARAAYAVLIRAPPANVGDLPQNTRGYDGSSNTSSYSAGPRTFVAPGFMESLHPSTRLHQSPFQEQLSPVQERSMGIQHSYPDETFRRSVSSSGSSPDGGTVDLSLLAAEDRRRRNTEASARFRSKKKERLDTIEQNMSVLQRRADDLEKEAVELRRENGWLKEMVIMKGKRGGQMTGQTMDGLDGEGSDDDRSR